MKFPDHLPIHATTHNKVAHRHYLAQPFEPKILLDDFTDEERAILEKYGAWMQAIDSGKLKWETAGQKHLIEVALRFVEPENDLERAWLKYLSISEGRREDLTNA
jgi:uncharacterized protein YifE (UPF0438 family)